MTKKIFVHNAIVNERVENSAYVMQNSSYEQLNLEHCSATKWKIEGAQTLEKLLKKFRQLNRLRNLKNLSPALMVIPLSACGSGGGDSAPEVSGRAIDGYLGGSTVYLSSNPEVTVLTSNEAGQQGLFSGLFGTGSIVVTGGIDTSTGKVFTGELRAPEGAKVVTPLTTIVEAVVRTAEASGGAPVSVEEASAKIAAGLGLSAGSNLLEVDFIAEDSGGQAKAAAQVASVLSLVTAAGGVGAASAAIEKVAAKITIAADAGVKSTVLTNAAQITEVLTEVASEGKFVSANASVDLDSVVNNISQVVETVNARIEVATSVKDILATQSAVQDDFVEKLTKGEAVDVDAIDAIVAEAVAEVEAYFEELAALGIDTGIDVTEELDLADVNTEIEEEVVEPEVVATPGDTKKGVQESDIPEEGILNFNSGIKYLASELQLAIDEASAGDTLVLGSGRYNADVEVKKALSIYGANFNQAINQDENGDAKAGFLDEAGNADASGIKFDFADAQRSDHGESWIDGSITVSADNVTLNGLRLHLTAGR